MREKFLTPDLSISGNFEQLWFWWQKRSPRWGKNFWHQIYPFQAISSNFGFGGRKDPPPPRWGENFSHQIYPFQAISSNFGFGGRKTPHPTWGKIFGHQIYPFQAILSNFGFGGRKPPLPRWGKNFWHQIYPFQAILSNFGFGGRKAHPDEGNFFDTRSIHFREFWATLVLVAEKPPHPPDEGKIFWHQIYPFQAILSNFGFGGRKDPSPSQMRGKFLIPDISISGNFKQLWFWWQKRPPTATWGKIFGHQIYPFQEILSNFGFGGRKPPLPRWGKNFWHQIYPFQAILSNFGFGGRKAPHPQMRENFLTPDLSISGNFELTLVLVAEKPPPPPRWGKIFLTPDISISGNFEQLWFWWQKSPPLPIRENFLTPDLSISGNFEQLWFWWQKSPPPPHEGKIFDTRSIHFRQFRATLVLVAEKPASPPRWGKNFWHQIYPFQAISSNFGFGGRKDHPCKLGKIFWHQIYPLQPILSNFGFGGRKAPLSFVPPHEET